jgi:type I restriction enzyme M protein
VNASTLVQNLWNCCNVLRDNGMSYGDRRTVMSFFDHYRHVLKALGQHKGALGLILGKAQNKFQDPAKLRRLVVDLIDAETWSALGVVVKGDAYEALLEKNAQDTKSVAGQYFTPRALIQAMVDASRTSAWRANNSGACFDDMLT